MTTTAAGPTLHPYDVPAPEGARPMGTAPYLSPGDVVHWRYRDHGWTPGRAETATPMRVVRDDERGLVAWLAPGTVQLTKRYPDGSDLRDVPMAQRFSRDAQRVQARSAWRGAGILRIAPTDRPWSVWLFWDAPEGAGPDAWTFEGWYVNLENAHRRIGVDTFTGDHVLDLWVEADGTVHVKDADELEAAEQQHRVDPAVGAAVRANAEHARTALADGEWPFAAEWTRWRPDPSWTPPPLPAEARWALDLLPDAGALADAPTDAAGASAG